VVTQPPVQLSSPREWLEVYDSEGQPTGRARRRSEIHQDGDWHLAFFCWVARPGARGPEVLLQHRAARKDVWPLRFDASAAGHVRFGESLQEAAREVREELGFAVDLADLIPLGRHRQQHRHTNGLIDREYHALHLLTPGPPDSAYVPDPEEVAGLAWIDADDLLGLAEGRLASVEVRYRAVDAADDQCIERTLTSADLVPYDDGYHRRLIDEIRQHVRS
jgi:isopentenyldiphosphate isomerase